MGTPPTPTRTKRKSSRGKKVLSYMGSTIGTRKTPSIVGGGSNSKGGGSPRTTVGRNPILSLDSGLIKFPNYGYGLEGGVNLFSNFIVPKEDLDVNSYNEKNKKQNYTFPQNKTISRSRRRTNKNTKKSRPSISSGGKRESALSRSNVEEGEDTFMPIPFPQSPRPPKSRSRFITSSPSLSSTQAREKGRISSETDETSTLGSVYDGESLDYEYEDGYEGGYSSTEETSVLNMDDFDSEAREDENRSRNRSLSQDYGEGEEEEDNDDNDDEGEELQKDEDEEASNYNRSSVSRPNPNSTFEDEKKEKEK